jgi:hypothetical protein
MSYTKKTLNITKQASNCQPSARSYPYHQTITQHKKKTHWQLTPTTDRYCTQCRKEVAETTAPVQQMSSPLAKQANRGLYPFLRLKRCQTCQICSPNNHQLNYLISPVRHYGSETNRPCSASMEFSDFLTRGSVKGRFKKQPDVPPTWACLLRTRLKKNIILITTWLHEAVFKFACSPLICESVIHSQLPREPLLPHDSQQSEHARVHIFWRWKL